MTKRGDLQNSKTEKSSVEVAMDYIDRRFDNRLVVKVLEWQACTGRPMQCKKAQCHSKAQSSQEVGG